MGRGSGGVAQAKGKELTSAQMKSMSVTTYNKLRTAIENGRSTKATENAYERQLKGFSTQALENQHKKNLDSLFYLEGRRGELAKTAYEVRDRMELAERVELMRRDPEKYGVDWYAREVQDSRRRMRGSGI